jgi:ribosomal protein S18 acetylase RimI-like enzyme
MIRPATGEDAQNLAALAIQVWLHTYATSGIRSSLAAYALTAFTQANFETLLQDPTHTVLLAEIEDHLVGYADLAFESPRVEVPDTRTELATLYVQEHFAGMGIGSSLLEACAAVARERCGSPDFWLSVYHGNARAIAFYRKHGFTTRGSFPFVFGGESHENFVLAKAAP